MRALISVYDKTGVVEFARALAELGFEIWASGGTARELAEGGVFVRDLSRLTGFSDLLGGRVKTLHPKVFAGILAKEDQLAELEALGAPAFDLVAVNFYPFWRANAQELSPAEALELIDIGGPALLRAAAKNYPRVWAVADPADYPEVVRALKEGAGEEVRRRLAEKAFYLTARYDAEVLRWFTKGEEFPKRVVLPLEQGAPLRYGENPHQKAALYLLAGEKAPVAAAEVVRGNKEMSYNNYADTEAAWRLVLELDQPAAAIIKHQMPSGVALGTSLKDAFARALAADPVSAFGGVVAFNRPLDLETAEAMAGEFFEVVVAPEFTPEAKRRLRAKKNLRLVRADPEVPSREWRPLLGALVREDTDRRLWQELKVVTEKKPSEEEFAALAFAWVVAKHARSNAVVVADGERTLGIGQGQTSRIDAARIALERAGERARGAVLASDGFFPFDDVVRLAARYGISAIIQPGGSKRDADSIKAANEAGIAMVFTGLRHFSH